MDEQHLSHYSHTVNSRSSQYHPFFVVGHSHQVENTYQDAQTLPLLTLFQPTSAMEQYWHDVQQWREESYPLFVGVNFLL